MASLPGLRKAAVMLNTLPREEAAALLERLGPHGAALVSKEMARTGQAQGADIRAILDEFTNAIPASRPTDTPKSIEVDSIQRQLGAAPFSFLDDLDGPSLLTLLRDEHPQTIALVACCITSVQAAEVIAGLPESQQAAVIRRIAAMDEIKPEIVRDVERGLIAHVLQRTAPYVGGIECLAEILRFIDPTVSIGLIERLNGEDPELADRIGRSVQVSHHISLKTSGPSASRLPPRGTSPARAA